MPAPLPPEPDLPGSGRWRPGDLAVIAAGGMLGASLRYGLTRALPTATDHFPWATFWTNLSGSFLLGYLLAALVMRPALDPRVRLFFATGVLGAFTTMSTYAVETAVLAKDGHGTIAAAYAVSSVALGLVLGASGVRLGRRRA